LTNGQTDKIDLKPEMKSNFIIEITHILKKFQDKKILLLLWMFSFASLMNAQKVEIAAKIDSSNILVGDQVHLRIDVKQSPNLSVLFPQFKDTITRAIEILEEQDKDTTWITNTEIHVEKDYLVTSFDSGFHYVPPMKFIVESANRKDSMQSRPLSLTVHTMPVDTLTEILDIKGPYEAPLSFAELVPYIAIGLLIVFIILLAYFVIKKRKKNEPVFKRQKPLEPPHVAALRELNALSEKKLWQQGRLKEYYSLLTEIIRKYIEGRYQVHAMEQTSDEIIEALMKHDIPNEAFDELKSLLTLADFVKFAKATPLPEENDRSFHQAYNFVRRTKYIETNAEDEKEEGETITKNNAEEGSQDGHENKIEEGNQDVHEKSIETDDQNGHKKTTEKDNQRGHKKNTEKGSQNGHEESGENEKEQ